MGTSLPNPILTESGDLIGVVQKVLFQAQAMAAQGDLADTDDLWPTQLLGDADRKIISGTSNIQRKFHSTLKGGAFLEKHLGEALSAIQTRKADIEEKIQHWLAKHRLAVDGQLPDNPRAVKYVADAIQFIDAIQACITDSYALVASIQANIQMLLQIERRMINMVQANINSIANMLNEICNWGLPSLCSMAARLGALFHFNGFNFNQLAGFRFNASLTSLNPNFNLGNFSFRQCIARNSDFSSLFRMVGSVVSSDTSALTQMIPTSLGSFGIVAEFSDPSYIAKMQATTSPVLNPSVPVGSTSLPAPASVISNYSLTPTQYADNIISAVPGLNRLVIQPGAAPPSAATETALLAQCVTLGQIVSSGYDPNLTAAWLFYVNLNRAGRTGQWIPSFAAVYQAKVIPSIEYLSVTPIPWNQVLGSAAVNDAPPALPLIGALQADTSYNLLWRLSYVEASLLGYARNTTWDSAADAVYLASFPAGDIDYVSVTIPVGGATTTTVLGTGTAAYPVSATYPQVIAGNLAQVIASATANIANTPSYQSNKPQFRYTYDMFAQATLVDRYSQFWREFNANLITLLAQDPYVVSYVVGYVDTLNGAVNPLGDPASYNQILADAISRNRTWTFGSNLLPLPTALPSLDDYPEPTNQNNGWTSGTFNTAAFLSRPDIQAQALPTQVAMLRMNQCYAALLTTQANVQNAVADAIAQANASIQSTSVSGWSVETGVSVVVPPGASGVIVGFNQIDFDQTGYVQDAQTIVIPQASIFVMTATLNFDPAGASGVRTVNLLQNGIVQATAFGDNTSTNPFMVQFSTIISANAGDVMQIQALHSLPDSQTLLSGSTFLGLIDTGATATTTAVLASTPSTTLFSSDSSTTFTSGITFPALSAVAINSDGNIYPIVPTSTTPGQIPLVDGIALVDSTAAGESIQVATLYGAVFQTPGTTWTPGGLLYVAVNGTLTQDYATLSTTARWIVCVGRSVTAASFIYEPHLPTNYIQTF